jgi:hypothetical protein
MVDRRLRPRLIPWMRDALCIEYPQDWWFLDGPGGSGRKAKDVCQRCMVRAECLAYALENNEHHGIWAGYANHDLAQWRRPQPCPGCHRAMPVAEVAQFVLKKTDRRQWICRRCYYRDIQARRRA